MKLFRKSLLTLACLAASVLTAWSAAPRYIFYFIGDGMGVSPVMAAQTYNRLVLNNPDGLLMMRMGVTGLAQTFSASSPVTDSAAAGTALATGSKTKNSMLGMNADTIAVTSIARQLKDMGWGIGIVTNCAADDATPGAFYAHVPKRSMYYEVGKDAAASGYDFIAGAGLRGDVDKDGNATDLYDVIRQAGYQVLRGAKGAKEVAVSTSDKIMLLNPLGYNIPSEMGFHSDNVGADSIGLTLQIAMDACMQQLQRNSPERFFMMVEGGLIDHALHGDDGGSAIREVMDLDACIATAYRFYEQHPDETLIIVTADHNTGGMSVGCDYTGYNAYPQYLDYQKTSKDRFSDFCQDMLRSGQEITWPMMKEILKEKWGLFGEVPVSEKQEKVLEEAFRTSFVERDSSADEKGLYKTSMAFASAVSKVYNDVSGWGFTTFKHTGDMVPVYAVGVGADKFARTLNNIEIPQIIRSLTGIE